MSLTISTVTDDENAEHNRGWRFIYHKSAFDSNYFVSQSNF